MNRLRLFTIAFAICIAGLVIMVTAGNLNPSAEPGATMKTLDQVEARIPIPGNPYGAGTYTLSEAGSYYLTGDRLVAPGNYGLHITASNVTVDLNGFTLKEMSSATGNSGIYIDGAENVEIRNGTIRDFPGAGITASGANVRIFDIRILNNGGSGINLNGDGSHIRGCTVSNNGGSGIYAWNNAIVTGNTCGNNTHYGIVARHGSVVSENSCFQNGYEGVFTNNGLAIGNAGYGNTFGTVNHDSNSTYVNNMP